MLKSLRNSPATAALSIFQSQNARCSTNTDKREKILTTRYSQKQLYGRIIQSEPNGNLSIEAECRETTSNVKQLNNSKDPKTEINATEHNRASEFYWLVQRGSKTSKNIKILKLKRSPEENSVESTTPGDIPLTDTSLSRASPNNVQSHPQQSNQTTVSSAKKVIISAKNLIQELVSNKGTNRQNNTGQAIPFDDAALNSMLNYPLIGEKVEMGQAEELLSDISLRLPSISKVLQATMPESSRIALKKWKLGKIAELGVDGFKQYEEETLTRGKNFHLAIENYLSHGDVPGSDSSIINLWESVHNSLKELQPKPIFSEQPILHANLKYKGIIDNVSVVRNELCAFEWKTSEKAKPRLASTYDAPVQLCAYLGALNVDPRYDVTVKVGRVVVAYKNGDAANVFDLTDADLRKYWLIWLRRLQEYWIRVRDGTLPEPV